MTSSLGRTLPLPRLLHCPTRVCLASILKPSSFKDPLLVQARMLLHSLHDLFQTLFCPFHVLPLSNTLSRFNHAPCLVPRLLYLLLLQASTFIQHVCHLIYHLSASARFWPFVRIMQYGKVNQGGRRGRRQSAGWQVRNEGTSLAARVQKWRGHWMKAHGPRGNKNATKPWANLTEPNSNTLLIVPKGLYS